MREIRQSGSEGGARFNPLSLPLSSTLGLVIPSCRHWPLTNLTFPAQRDETAALNFEPHFGIMNRTLSHLLRAPRLCCGISLLLATCAFGDTASRFATSDLTKTDFFPLLDPK